jgi:hypothetical protein
MIEDLVIEWNRDFCDLEHDFNRFDQIANRAKSRPKLTVAKGRMIEEKIVPMQHGGLVMDVEA